MNNFSGARKTERKELWGRRHGECPSHDSLVCAGYLKGPLRHSPRVTPLSERCLPSQQRVWAVCLGQKDSKQTWWYSPGFSPWLGAGHPAHSCLLPTAYLVLSQQVFMQSPSSGENPFSWWHRFLTVQTFHTFSVGELPKSSFTYRIYIK